MRLPSNIWQYSQTRDSLFRKGDGVDDYGLASMRGICVERLRYTLTLVYLLPSCSYTLIKV